MLNGSQRLHNRFLEGELYTGLCHVEVLVIGQEGLVNLVPSVVKHAQDILVERVVQAQGHAVNVTTTNAGSASAGPILHVAVGVVVTTASVVVFAVGEVIQTGVVVACNKLKRLAVHTAQDALLVVVLVAVTQELDASLHVTAKEVVVFQLVGILPPFDVAPAVDVVLGIDVE